MHCKNDLYYTFKLDKAGNQSKLIWKIIILTNCSTINLPIKNINNKYGEKNFTLQIDKK